MASTPMPDLTVPQNVGFVETDAAPIIHSARWRHLPTRYTFTDVGDVITYHEDGPLVINMVKHTVSHLDIYLLRSAVISSIKVYLRFIRDVDGVLIEEPYTVGEGGATIKLENDLANPDLQIVKGITFTQVDLKNGTPMYDFPSMSNEGIYEVWLKAVTSTGKELHVRVPFEWEMSTTTPPVDPEPEPEEPVEPPGHIGYDEYQVIIVEGSSPFTKRSTTHYRMAGVGMLETPYCFTRVDTPASPSINKPTLVPIIGDKPAKPCGFSVSPVSLQVDVGEVAEFTLVHENTSGVMTVTIDADTTAVTDLEDGAVEVTKVGSHTIEFIVVYEDGQECTYVVTATGVEPEPVPPKPGVLPDVGVNLILYVDGTGSMGSVITSMSKNVVTMAKAIQDDLSARAKPLNFQISYVWFGDCGKGCGGPGVYFEESFAFADTTKLQEIVAKGLGSVDGKKMFPNGDSAPGETPLNAIKDSLDKYVNPAATKNILLLITDDLCITTQGVTADDLGEVMSKNGITNSYAVVNATYETKDNERKVVDKFDRFTDRNETDWKLDSWITEILATV